MFIYQSSREFNDLRGGEAIRPTFAQADAHPHRGIGLEELLQLLTAAFGTSLQALRHRTYGRYWRCCGHGWTAASASPDANDPSLPFDDQFCCDARQGSRAT